MINDDGGSVVGVEIMSHPARPVAGYAGGVDGSKFLGRRRREAAVKDRKVFG